MLSWIDRTGKTEPTQTSVQLINPRVSRDGTSAVGLLMDDTGRPDAAVLDLERGTTTRLTFEGQVRTPLLTYDGRRVIFGATIGDVHGIYVTESDGSTKPRLAFTTETLATPVGVAPDGQTVLFTERARIYVRRLDAPATEAAKPLHESPPGQEGAAQISPDGRWVAYTSDESGRFEVYMHEFPGPGRRERVSINGAQFVRWVGGWTRVDLLEHRLDWKFRRHERLGPDHTVAAAWAAERPVHDERHAGERLHRRRQARHRLAREGRQSDDLRNGHGLVRGAPRESADVPLAGISANSRPFPARLTSQGTNQTVLLY